MHNILKRIPWQAFRRGWWLALAVFAAIWTTTPVQAQSTVADGVALVQADQVDAARDLFSKLADAGDPQAMYHLGALYHSGASGSQDLQKAIHWYRKAADAGASEAKLALGSLLYKGKGVAKDLAAALKLFSEAANAGLLSAQYNLAMMHVAGLAHTKEYNADEDKPRAYKWFTIVLSRLETDEERAAVQDGIDFLKKDMTQHEIARGKVMAREWLAAHPAGGKAQ